MIKQAKQLTRASSWTKETVIIKGQSNYDHDFMYTKPNSFYVMNRGENSIYIGIKDIPSKTRFEHRIAGGSSDVFGQPDGTTKLYFYNDSANDITIDLYSYDGAFDISILKKLAVTISGDFEGGFSGESFDGLIRGFAEGVSLPSGTNLLGRVAVNDPTNVGAWTVEDVVYMVNYLQNTARNTDDTVANLGRIESLVSNLNLPWTGSRITELLETITGLSVATGEQVTGTLKTYSYNAKSNSEYEMKATEHGYSYYDNIFYLRAIGGNFVFKLLSEEGQFFDRLPELNLNDGESFNDFKGRCYGVWVKPVDENPTGAKIEMVCSMK